MKFHYYIFSSIILIISSVYAQSCNPSNCPSSCTPGCLSDEICTLGTMVNCGICPTPKCIPKSIIPSLNNSNGSNSKSNSGLIGGVVGGLLGGGLILGGFGYLFIRHRNKKKNNLPLAFRHNIKNQSTSTVNQNTNRNTTISTASNRTSRQIVSGVIPVTFIPPTNSIHSSFYSEAETPRSHIGSFATFANNDNDDDDDNPFSDRPISTAHSFVTTTTNTDYQSRRDSIESNISHQPSTATVATQMLRAKPQIMRVNTVRVQDGIARSGSVKKTIKPESKENEDPFDDKNVARQSIIASTTSTKITANDTRSNKVTDSVMSSAADGEITIFFNGS